MAGLAALLTFGSDRTTTHTLEALSEALTPRGSDEAIVEFGAARLLLRAELPKVYESDGVVVIVDGIAETSSLISRYSSHGPSGLVYGQQPYALVLAEPDGLVLARNLDGPPLYYAKSRGAVMMASEPRALLAAGVPARPNDEIVSRYLAYGACDEVPATFIDGIRRVLPGQVIEIRRHTDGWAIRAHPPAPTRADRMSDVRMALRGDERVGVVLQPDLALPTAALLGVALAARRSVPVYSANFPGLTTTSSGFASALLSPVPDGLIKHRALPFFADEIDVDTLVADLGEPVPSLPDYLLWAIARATGGEVDVLLAARGWNGSTGHLSRLADRVAARYGVTLRFPFRELDGEEELFALAKRTLPHASVRAATTANASMEPPLHEVIERLRPEIASALLYPAHGEADHAALARLANLASAKRTELERLWRHYVLQRWLRSVIPAPSPKPVSARPDQIAGWQRRLVHTEPIAAGENLSEKFGWYLAEFVNAADKSTRQALRQPWLAAVAAKPVAVAQGQARAVWEIEPGWLARALVRLRGGDAWSTQFALERLGFRATWREHPHAVSPPREDACPPGHLFVVGPPRDADRTAKEIVDALRRALPDEIAAALRGCAIVRGGRILGSSGSVEPLVRLCEDDPFGERTPLMVALVAPRKQGRKPKRR